MVLACFRVSGIGASGQSFREGNIGETALPTIQTTPRTVNFAWCKSGWYRAGRRHRIVASASQGRCMSNPCGMPQLSNREGIVMKKLLAVWLCCGCLCAHAQTADELINAGKNTENVPVQGMGYDLKNYSPLRQINKSNIKRLVPIWSISLMNDFGETAQPTIYNGVMY